jgi:hypothetical protein
MCKEEMRVKLKVRVKVRVKVTTGVDTRRWDNASYFRVRVRVKVRVRIRIELGLGLGGQGQGSGLGSGQNIQVNQFDSHLLLAHRIPKTTKDADATLAWLFSQLPFVAGKKPSLIVSLSWPTNMEAQDLFPSISSNYTFPTGTKVDVPCFAQNKVVDIERTECPDSFVNPMDPHHDRPCVKVLHGSTKCLHS